MRISFDRTRILKALGYSVFFSAIFSLMLLLTFPYSIIADRLQSMASEKGYLVTIGSLGPSFSGLKAKRVSVVFPATEPGAERPALMVDAVTVRPALFPPGLAFGVTLPGGTIDGGLGLLGARKLLLTTKGLDLAKSNLKPLTGLDLLGKLNLNVDLKLDKTNAAKTQGRIALNGDALMIAGGTVSNFDLPRLDLGRLESDIQLADGKATVKVCRTRGGDAEANLDGDVTLAESFLMSSLRLKLKFKPKEEFLQKNSLIAGGLNMAMSKDSQGYYSVNIERSLGNPNFRPQR